MTPASKKTIKEPKTKRIVLERAPRAKKTATEPLVEVRVAEVTVAVPVQAMPKRQYLQAVGRRKTAGAVVRLYKNGSGIIRVNGKDVDAYFVTKEMRDNVR